MQKDYPPIPANTEPRLARLIAMTRGRIIIGKLNMEIDEELHAWLTSTPPLPPLSKSDAGHDDHE